MKVAYDVTGSGEPVLLVIGLGQTRRRWRRVVPLLVEQGYEVVTFDNRETGGTGPCPDGFTLADIAQDALDLMADLGRSTFFLGGHSMGGMISQEIVRLAPDRVRAAALFSTHGGASIFTPAGDASVLMATPGDDRPQWAKLAGPGFWEAHPDVIHEEQQLSVEQATPPEGYMRQLQAIQQFDPGAAVRDAGVPVIVGHGDADPLVPYENGVRLAAHLGCDLVTWPGAGHVVECERPAEMAAVMDHHFRTANKQQSE